MYKEPLQYKEALQELQLKFESATPETNEGKELIEFTANDFNLSKYPMLKAKETINKLKDLKNDRGVQLLLDKLKTFGDNKNPSFNMMLNIAAEEHFRELENSNMTPEQINAEISQVQMHINISDAADKESITSGVLDKLKSDTLQLLKQSLIENFVKKPEKPEAVINNTASINELKTDKLIQSETSDGQLSNLEDTIKKAQLKTEKIITYNPIGIKTNLITGDSNTHILTENMCIKMESLSNGCISPKVVTEYNGIPNELLRLSDALNRIPYDFINDTFNDSIKNPNQFGGDLIIEFNPSTGEFVIDEFENSESKAIRTTDTQSTLKLISDLYGRVKALTPESLDSSTGLGRKLDDITLLVNNREKLVKFNDLEVIRNPGNLANFCMRWMPKSSTDIAPNNSIKRMLMYGDSNSNSSKEFRTFNELSAFINGFNDFGDQLSVNKLFESQLQTEKELTDGLNKKRDSVDNSINEISAQLANIKLDLETQIYKDTPIFAIKSNDFDNKTKQLNGFMKLRDDLREFDIYNQAEFEKPKDTK